MAAIDAEQAYNDGVLRQIVRGAVRQRLREGRALDILPEVAVPVARLADNVRRMGDKATADSILAHAVHDGIGPSVLAEAVRDNTEAAVVLIPNAGLVIGANAEIISSTPPAASDLSSALTLANYMRAQLIAAGFMTE